MIEELPVYQRVTPRYRFAEEVLFETIAGPDSASCPDALRPDGVPSGGDVLPRPSNRSLQRARAGIVGTRRQNASFRNRSRESTFICVAVAARPRIVEQIPGGENLWYEVNDLLPQAQYVSRLIGELPSLRFVFHRLMTLWERNPVSRAGKTSAENNADADDDPAVETGRDAAGNGKPLIPIRPCSGRK